jgi:hypothetical protein
MNLIFRRYFSCILFSAYFCSFVPTNSEAATLRQKLISGATQIYSKILGRNSNTNLCQDIFSNQVLDSDIPRVSDDLKQALRNYLKLYYVQKNQNLSPMVVSQAFRQLALQASKEGFTQEQIMNLKKDLVQNNYADVIFPHQELHEFVALSEIEEGTPTETKTSFHHLFSIANESSNALQLKTNAIKLVPPEELTFTEASKKFPKISLPLTPPDYNFPVQLFSIITS